MTVLVTGATGFLGGAVACRLHDLGQPVLATGRNMDALAGLQSMGLETMAADLAHSLDPNPNIEAIVHSAALSSPWGHPRAFESANVTVTANLIDFARRSGVGRFVHISSASVYFRFQDQDQLPETTVLPPPVNLYAKTKAQSEQLVLAAPDIGPIILRPRGIYGVGDTALLPRLSQVAKKSRLPRFPGGMGATDITHVDDVVAATLAALDAPGSTHGEIFNISGGQCIGMDQIICAIARHHNIPVRWRTVPFGLALSAVRMIETAASVLPGRPEPPVTAYSLALMRYRQTMDITKAKTHLNWQPQVSFPEGFRRTFGADLPQ
ncbi:NAD-dependent epimerase/dehydratase family protein [Pseudaestuariivita rosea]|uniref:NAD-dependent epimerase/dehydratase family protein n=1 Tax=Pseudaestuariivita rosea TaxID=2763263 RepID=UPI001ABA079D|nr:NAD(P)-dependent oxidoreductase [Pseudaestuariivita rosea]